MYKEIIATFQAHQNERLANAEPPFVTSEGRRTYGISIVQLRKLIRPFIKNFTKLPFNEGFELATKLYDTEMAEGMICANALLGRQNKKYTTKEIKKVLSLVKRLVSWDSTDDFCMLLSQPLFLLHPNILIPIVRSWNKSRNTWVKRASVVTLTRKVGTTGQYTGLILELCEALIEDEHDLVRKAVGWCLKDAFRGDPKKIFPYLKQLRRRGVSSVITLYAARDIKGERRCELLDCKPD